MRHLKMTDLNVLDGYSLQGLEVTSNGESKVVRSDGAVVLKSHQHYRLA